jgi:Mn2+/Fe2+ NRAMP family transporter
MSKFSTYLIGYVIFVAGVALGANLLGVSSRWIAVVILVLVGIGIFAGAANTKRDDPPTA